MKKFLKWAAIGFVGLCVLGALIGSGEKDEATSAVAPPAAEAATQPEIKVESGKPGDVTPTAADKPAKAASKPAPKPTLTGGQRNAIKSAESYLDGPMAFSKTGLIKQLKFEGFSRSDAAFAVTHVHVSWNQQAAKSAESYIDGPMAFSRSGLIDQLKFEGFTASQAEYGVSKAYR